MLPFEFTRPALLLLIVPIAIVLCVWFVRSLSDFPRQQRIGSLLTRAVLSLLLVLALAGTTWLHQTDQQFVLFVVDQSLSVGESAAAAANEFMKVAEAGKGSDRTAYLPFAATVGTVQDAPVFDVRAPLRQGASPDVIENDASRAVLSAEDRSARDGTNLAAAIEAAAGYMPPGYVPRIVLLTDGNQTSGNVLAAASRSGIPVTTIPLPTGSEPEIQVSEVSVPAEVREGEPFFVDVTVHSNHDDEGLLEVYRGDHKVISETRTLKTGANKFRFQQSIERDRMAAFKVRLSGFRNDTLLDNNADAGLVYAAGKPRVLIIESDPDLIRELAYALEDEGIQVDVRPPQGMPDTLAGLQNYELLMLSNVPATALSQQQMEIARTWVQELGGGFVMLGGEQSFGLGGYYKSTLEEILPVRSDFEKEKEKPSLGMVLVIDRSGSMDGDPLEMAKTAARSAVELLGNRDQVAVLAFDDQTYVISEMQSASNKGKVSDEIARIDSGGGTNMYPAMEMSFEILNSTSAKLKHVIMLTDGVSNAGDFEGMAQQMVSAKMTVSTVALGGAATDLLESIARIGKGRYYLAEDPSQIPQIFAKETVTATKSAIDEQPFIPQVVRATHTLKEIDMEAAPFLLGYVMTRPKPTSEVILATEKGDPLLVWWRYGLGMTAAFTSDAKSRWAAEWLTWPGYGKFWTQVVRQTMRKSDSRGIQVAVSREGRQTMVSVDAVNEVGQFLNSSEVELTVINPQLQRQKLPMKQTAPGRYAADFATQQSGAYNMEIALKQNGQVVYRQSRGLIVGYSDELRIQPTNEKLLQEVASVSAGRFNPPPEKLFERSGERAVRPTPMWPWLLTAAAFLLILDVALRRIDVALHLPVRYFKRRNSATSAN
ncbi:MAG: VWA domain-containing protein [Planctomycetaceae bacterium]|nr:VWA domain-containing protein [Planctomycetaceae bacterium]